MIFSIYVFLNIKQRVNEEKNKGCLCRQPLSKYLKRITQYLLICPGQKTCWALLAQFPLPRH